MQREAIPGAPGVRPIVAFTILLTCSAGAVRGALAQENAEPIRLAYRASVGCPDEASFVARIRTRTTRARIAWPGEAARTFSVVVEQGPPPSGRVIVQTGDRDGGTRRVQADTCSDVADALALVVALAIDPRAAVPPSASPPPAPSSSAPSAPSAPASSPVTARAGESGAFFAGADFAVATGVAPNLPSLGGSPFVGWRATGATLFEPSLRLAFLRVGSGPRDVPGGKAEFTWTVGRLDVCPIVWPRGVVRVVECARVEAGALEAARADVTSPEPKLQPWLTAGPLARAEWSFLDWAFIDAEVGALIRVTQDGFHFRRSDPAFYEVPPVGVTAGVGVGVHFF